MATAAFYTFGCRLNQADSGLLASQLKAAGYEIVSWQNGAEVMVINSCAVTATATSKCRRLVGSVRQKFPHCVIVFCGCAALDAVFSDGECGYFPDLVITNPKPVNLPSLLASVTEPGKSMTVVKTPPLEAGFTVPGVGMGLERTRANLKIQEGCSFNCTYCIVPQTRGVPRSRDFDDALREARALLDNGYRELVITGVNIATYHDHGRDLADLLEAILKLENRYHGDFRIRLGSTEPGPVLDRLLDLMSRESRLCRFLHLPMQYGDDMILQRMGRHYDCEQYCSVVRRAAELLPGVCIGSDIMVGFPGEDDRAFEHCMKLLEELPMGLMHVFSYSPRPNTPAATWKDRPDSDIVKLREAKMLALSEHKAHDFARSQIGKMLPVLIENGGCGRRTPSGWSDNYLKVLIKDSPVELVSNQLCQCRIIALAENADNRTVIGELVQ